MQRSGSCRGVGNPFDGYLTNIQRIRIPGADLPLVCGGPLRYCSRDPNACPFSSRLLITSCSMIVIMLQPAAATKEEVSCLAIAALTTPRPAGPRPRPPGSALGMSERRMTKVAAARAVSLASAGASDQRKRRVQERTRMSVAACLRPARHPRLLPRVCCAHKRSRLNCSARGRRRCRTLDMPAAATSQMA